MESARTFFGLGESARSDTTRKVTRLLVAGALALTAMSGRAALIGTVGGCIENPQYTFCSANFSADVSGNQWEFDVVFGSGAYIEALVSNPVDISIFDLGQYPSGAFENFTVALLGLDGQPLANPVFSPKPVDAQGLRTISSNSIAVGTKIGGIHVSMECNSANLPIEATDPCPVARTLSTVSIEVDGRAEDEVTLRVGRTPPTMVSEPAGWMLMLMVLATVVRSRFRRV